MFIAIEKLYRTSQVRELDRIAISDFNIPGYQLMQRAGDAAFTVLQDRWPKATQIVVVCGKGNNAGDGYIVARLAHEAQLQVKVLYLSPIDELKGDARIAAEACQQSGVLMERYSPELSLECDLIVDAILGTGLKGEVQAEYRQVIDRINSTDVSVLALDVPSGLCADSGAVLGAAIEANVTVTFVACKRGFVTDQAYDYCGELLLNDLDVSAEVFAKVEPVAAIMSLERLQRSLPPRKRTAHKGNFGHVLVIGGDYGMAGAARLAGEAAARVGSGLTTVATRAEHVAVVSGARPELMCFGVDRSRKLRPLLERATVIVIGPGLGSSAWAKELLKAALDVNKPLVLDADALNLLATMPRLSRNWILTPHPGEAARLLECSTKEVQADRFGAVGHLQRRYGGVCILKGAHTLVSSDDAEVGVCLEGNPGMASGGMGDVLSGIIGGFLAQGLEPATAARLAVMVHATAADKVVAEGGERGILAGDLVNYIRYLIN